MAYINHTISAPTAPILVSEPHRCGFWGNTIIQQTTTTEHYAAHGYYDTWELLWLPKDMLVIDPQPCINPIRHVPEGTVCAANLTGKSMVDGKYQTILPESLFVEHQKHNFDLLPCYVTIRRYGIPPKANQQEYLQRRRFELFKGRIISIISKIRNEFVVRTDTTHTEIITSVRSKGLQYDLCKHNVGTDFELSDEAIRDTFETRIDALTKVGML